jgi:putative copper export protein
LGEPLVWVRAVHFAATLSVTGAVLFVALLAEPAFRQADDRGEVSARVRPWFSAIEWVSLALVVVSGAAWLVIQSAQMGDVPWSEAVSEGLVQTVLLGTDFGNDWIVRTVLAALLVVTVAVARPARDSSRRADWLACVLASPLPGRSPGRVMPPARPAHLGSFTSPRTCSTLSPRRRGSERWFRSRS